MAAERRRLRVGRGGGDLDHVLEALRDLGLAAARHGGRLVEVGSLGQNALEVPGLVGARLRWSVDVESARCV
jgi:hypothetical protein